MVFLYGLIMVVPDEFTYIAGVDFQFCASVAGRRIDGQSQRCLQWSDETLIIHFISNEHSKPTITGQIHRHVYIARSASNSLGDIRQWLASCSVWER